MPNAMLGLFACDLGTQITSTALSAFAAFNVMSSGRRTDTDADEYTNQTKYAPYSFVAETIVIGFLAIIMVPLFICFPSPPKHLLCRCLCSCRFEFSYGGGCSLQKDGIYDYTSVGF